MLGIFGVAIQKTIFLSIWIKKCGLLGSYSSVKTILYFRVRRDDSIFRVLPQTLTRRIPGRISKDAECLTR